MKKKLFVLALIAICLSITAYGTMAYFTYEDTATNVISAGSIQIAVREWSEDAEGEREPFENVIHVLPGNAVSKIVEIENIGLNAAWIRVSAEKAIELAVGVEGQVDLSLVTFDLNTEFWTEQDGYYYYNLALQPGETTAPLFTQVAFSLEMGNLYQNSTATVTIAAQATQVAHNGQTVFEATLWPASE